MQVYCPTTSEAQEIRPAVRGFSLIELLVVLALVALSLSVIAPRVGNSIDTSRLKASTRDLLATARHARTLAQTQQREVTLTIDVVDRSYRLDDAKRLAILPSGTKVSVVGAQSERLSDDVAGIRFFADGSTTGGEIELSFAKQSYAIEVDWLTGLARLNQ